MTVTQVHVQHLAIVMDGNQRWAIQQGLPGPEGHRVGAKAVKTIVTAAARFGVPALTLFAFSSENWCRPDYEVDLLMTLFCESIDQQIDELHQNNIRLRFIGDLTRFEQKLLDRMSHASDKTQHNTGLQLNIAVNYGGQWDILQAAKQMAQYARDTNISIDNLSEADFSQYLSLSDLPPVDMLIRTSGEQRISNFLLWQIAYAELYFSPTLWPDFGVSDLKAALKAFKTRGRRFGYSSQAILYASKS